MLGMVVGRFGGSNKVTAQISSSENEYTALHGRIHDFFENLTDSNKGPKKALEELLRNSPITGDEALTNTLVEKMKDINTRFGAYLAFEVIGTKQIGSDLVLIRYIYKCQNYPVVWNFIFYRPLSKTGDTTSRQWTLIGLRFDSNLDNALRDSGY